MRLITFFGDVAPLLLISCSDTEVNVLLIFTAFGFIELSTISGVLVSYCYIILSVLKIHSAKVLQERDPFQGPKLGSCLTLGNELSEETHVLTKQEILLGKGTRVESSRVREPRRTALLRGSQSRVLW